MGEPVYPTALVRLSHPGERSRVRIIGEEAVN